MQFNYNYKMYNQRNSEIEAIGSPMTVTLNQRLYTLANLRKMNKNTIVENRIASLGFIGALLVGRY